MLAGAVALAVACYSTAYRPVVECQAQLRLAERTPARAVEHLEAAAAADPLSAEPWQRLAAARFEAWRLSPSRAAFEHFEQADAEALRLGAQLGPGLGCLGDWYLQAISAAKRRGEKAVDDAIGKAVAAYGRAVQLYPNSARISGETGGGLRGGRRPARIPAGGRSRSAAGREHSPRRQETARRTAGEARARPWQAALKRISSVACGRRIR